MMHDKVNPPTFGEFIVVAVSKNSGAFGHHGHVLISRDAVAFEVQRHVGSWLDGWPVGKIVQVPCSRGVDGALAYNWSAVYGGEMFARRLPTPPAKVVADAWKNVANPNSVAKSRLAAWGCK